MDRLALRAPGALGVKLTVTEHVPLEYISRMSRQENHPVEWSDFAPATDVHSSPVRRPECMSTTKPAWLSRRTHAGIRAVSATITLGAALIHLAVAPEHMHEYVPFGVFFLATRWGRLSWRRNS